ncbi:MAG: hypothetical protein IJG13_08865 [Kiritimatiellae bacterium]|nr:hypothetical protein [Kiritimatiellia bacterium]MBQ3340940.1 hypothetical protein [Kiritimatiellia bacterium]
MKRTLLAAIAFMLASATFAANEGIYLMAEALDGEAVRQELAAAPRLAAMWNAHAMGAASVSNVAAQTYTGSAITPTPAVKLNGTTLTAGTDFTFSYSSNTNAGFATIYMTAAKAGLFGVAKRRFEIVPADISAAVFGSISASTNATPTPTVTLGGTTLVNDRDFKFAYVYSGVTNVFAVGIGNYTGSAYTNFVITAGQ